jgi:small subunit ribosomal protein S4
LQPGDVIRVKNRAKSLEAVQANMSVSGRPVPDFLQLVEGAIPEGVMSRLPEPDDVSIPVQPQLIVELCSR